MSPLRHLQARLYVWQQRLCGYLGHTWEPTSAMVERCNPCGAYRVDITKAVK